MGERFSFPESSGVLMAVEARDDLVGVLWRESLPEGWTLFFGTFRTGDPAIGETVDLGVIASTLHVGLQPFGDGFVVAWVDFEGCVLGHGCPDDPDRPGRIHVAQIVGGATSTNVVVEGSLPGHVALGVFDRDLVVLWEEDDFDADRATIQYRTSRDGLTFGAARLLYEGPGSFGGIHTASSSGPLAIAWLAGSDEDESAPRLAFVEGETATDPIRMRGQPDRTWGLQIAAGDAGVGVTTISFEDRLYFGVTDPTGGGEAREVPIGSVPSDVDVAWGGAGFALVSWGYLNGEGGESMLAVQQADAAGQARFGPVEIESSPAGSPTITTIGSQRYVVLWWGAGLHGAEVNCAP